MTHLRCHLRRASSGASLALLLALAGCGSPLSHGERAQRDACRARADQVYSAQNRGDMYEQDALMGGGRDTPFAGTSLYAAKNDALGGRFAREQMVDRCVRGAAGNVGSTLDGVDPTRDPTRDEAPAAPSGAPSHRPAPNPLAAPPRL
jgi:hypothetical protein